MYFIIGQGLIGIGYSLLTQDSDSEKYKIAMRKKGSQVVGDHYVINNKHSNFVYIAVADTNTFAMTNEWLMALFRRFYDH